MRRFFRSEGAYLDWLQEPAAHLVEARDSALDVDARLQALGNLFAALDQAHGQLAALQRQDVIDENLRDDLEVVMPAYAEELLAAADALWQEELTPLLASRGLQPRRVDDLSPAELDSLEDYFMRRVYPLLTPLAVDPGHPFPFISSGSANLLVELHDTRALFNDGSRHLYARVKVPMTSPILVDLNQSPPVAALKAEHSLADAQLPVSFVWCGETVRHFVAKLFTGMNITNVHFFRLLRAGPASPVEPGDRFRPRSRASGRDHPGPPVVRLDIERSMPLSVLGWLSNHVDVPAHGVVRSSLILELACLPPLFTQVCTSVETGDTPGG